MHAVCKLLRLRVVRQFALHPDQVRIRRIRHRAVDRALAAALVPVVPFTRPRCLPVKVDMNACQSFSNGTCFGVALALGCGQEFLDQALFIDMYTRVDGVDDSFMEQFEVGLLDPGIFDCLELVARFSGLLGSVHEFRKWLKSWVGAAYNIVVVPGVNS